MFTPYHPPEMSLTDDQLDEIIAASDVGIITIGRNAGEGGDRVVEDDFLLSDVERELLEKTCSGAFQNAQARKVIVVLNVSGVIETSTWKSKPDAILLAWQGGQEGGNSVADILSGGANPKWQTSDDLPGQDRRPRITRQLPSRWQDDEDDRHVCRSNKGGPGRSTSAQ